MMLSLLLSLLATLVWSQPTFERVPACAVVLAQLKKPTLTPEFRSVLEDALEAGPDVWVSTGRTAEGSILYQRGLSGGTSDATRSLPSTGVSETVALLSGHEVAGVHVSRLQDLVDSDLLLESTNRDFANPLVVRGRVTSARKEEMSFYEDTYVATVTPESVEALGFFLPPASARYEWAESFLGMVKVAEANKVTIDSSSRGAEFIRALKEIWGRRKVSPSAAQPVSKKDVQNITEIRTALDALFRSYHQDDPGRAKTASLSSQPSFRAAFLAVKAERAAKKKVTSYLFSDDARHEEEGDRITQSLHDLIPKKEKFGSKEKPIALEMQSVDVYKIQTDKGVRFFRPISMGEAVPRKPRRALAASILNQEVGLTTVAKTVWGTVNGEEGSLSLEAPGAQPREPFAKMLKNGKINARSLSNALAFEFLVGNSDGIKRNIRVDEHGNVTCFDHDFAFKGGLINVGDLIEKRELGIDLPDQYTPEFIERLKNLTPRKIHSKLDTLLSEVEIEGIVLRREILLKDIELRGAAAVFP